MSDTPPTDSNDKPPLHVAFGLSEADFADLVRGMKGVVRRVGCPAHVHPLEVVHDAFVTALCKPISERPSVKDKKRFVAWMNALAELSALTNRNSKHRRLLGDDSSESQIDALAAVAKPGDVIAAREVVRKALEVLSPDDRALIVARHVEGKTIAEIAREQNRRWSTVDSRHSRAMSLLRIAMRSLVAVAVLLVPKKVRAQTISWTARAPRFFAPLMQTTSAFGVTIVCGALVSANLSAAALHDEVTAGSTGRTLLVVAPVKPVEIAPPNSILPATNTHLDLVKPSVVDSAATQWSARDMKPSKVAGLLQGTVVPFAFLVAPAVVELGCAGANQQATSSAQEPEDDESGYSTGVDPYEGMCANERRRGNDCVSREEWYRQIGLCPDGTQDCQR